MASKTRKALSLEDKVHVIKLHNGGTGSRKIAALMGVGKTQINGIVKRKAEVLEEYESNVPSDRKRKIRKTGNEEVNELAWEWFKDATSRRLPVSGPMLQEIALKFANDLGNNEFKASNGWLESFRKRHQIVFGKMNGESGDVNDDVVKTWKGRLSAICEGYQARDIFNMDESGLYFKCNSDSTLHVKGDDCSGGKRSKERLTLMLCANLIGEKEKPLVIGKAKKPRCFGRIDPKTLPVSYYANRKAWMTSAVFEDWLRSFDRKVGRQRRKVLLFLDNAACHPNIPLRNVKLQFFPPNTTSRLQPMDQGIIQTLKLKYRKRELRRVITKMEENKTESGQVLIKATNVLEAIYGIHHSWKDVEAATITKCFRKAGFGDDEEETEEEVEESIEEEETDLEGVAQDLFGCSLRELIEIEETIATTTDTGGNWDRPAGEVLQELHCQDGDDSDKENDEERSVSKKCVVTSLEGASSMIDDLKEFAASSGFGDMMTSLQSLNDIINQHRMKKLRCSKQKKVTDFFK